MLTKFILCSAALSLLTLPAAAAGMGSSLGATVNSYTPAQEARARGAVTKAGYQSPVLAASQDGNFFFDATRGGDIYDVTVTRPGGVFASNGVPDKAPQG